MSRRTPTPAPAPTRLEPTEANPEPTAATGGNWIRDVDGGLRPVDEATATAAGLAWIAPTTTAPTPQE